MFRNVILAISLLINCLLVYIMFLPASTARNVDRMTCQQARSEIDNKRAVSAYADSHGSSLSKVHNFLVNSDYALRNVAVQGGNVTFVYTASFYPSTCGLHLPGVDVSIVRVETEIATDPRIQRVW